MPNNVNEQINRIRQNVADAYQALRDNGVDTHDTKSDYIDDNIANVYSNLQAVKLNESAIINVDLDNCQIIEITGVNVAP